MKFQFIFKRGPKTVATVTGYDVDAGALTIAEMAEQIPQMAAFIEKLTGLRCHIEQVG